MLKRIGVALVCTGTVLVVVWIRLLLASQLKSSGWELLPLLALVPVTGATILLWHSKSEALGLHAKFATTALMLSLAWCVTTMDRLSLRKYEILPDFFAVAFAVWFAFAYGSKKSERQSASRESSENKGTGRRKAPPQPSQGAEEAPKT